MTGIKELKKKGLTDVVFMFSFSTFVVVFVFITSQLAPYGVPQMSIIDLGILGSSIIGVGIACAVVTGLACVFGTIIASVLTLFIIPPVYAIVFTPMIFVYAYIIAKLARGD